jgi:hypothetical protein
MPDPGTFNLYPSVVPAVRAGDHRLRVTETIGYGDGTGAVQSHEPRLRVTSARYALPPDQLLSAFPPANAEGAFGTRLPQIVLKRRTLPWERVAGIGPGEATLPWLALVVLAEGEAKLSTEVEVRECVTPGVTLSGPLDVPKGLYVEVTQTVVDAVFPTKEDLPLLCHVREVDKTDTELGLGDDDGWMAVVLANRLPQPTVRDGVTTPLRYLACLINLEGQLGVLPDPADFEDRFVAIDAVVDYQAAFVAQFGGVDPDTYAMSGSLFGKTAGPLAKRVEADRGTAASTTTGVTAKVEPVSATWQVSAAAQPKTSAAEEAYVAVRDAMAVGWRFPIELVAAEEQRYRFPVLAHWSFTTTDGASFEELMLGLDVGLLGTLPPDPEAPAGAPPPPPRTQPPPEVTETGHVGLGHLTRRGDRTQAWYRGPLSPHVAERDAKREDGSLPMAHASDQLRRVTPDGREDLTYAAAFEIGRLLALSQPSVVAAQMRWRAEQFGAERTKRVAGGAFGELLGDITETRAAELGRLLGGRLLAEAEARPSEVLGPRRPVVDPGRPVPDLADGELDAVLAAGLGLDLDRLRETAGRLGVVGALAAEQVPVAPLEPEPVLDGPALEQLRGAAETDVGRVASMAAGGPDVTGPAALPTERAPDALDRLLAGLQPPAEGEERP